jgi:hypothetical protein
MPNEKEEESVACFELLLQCGECFLNFGLGSPLIGQNDDVIGRKTELIDKRFGRACGPLFEFLFVLCIPGNASKDQSARVGA